MEGQQYLTSSSLNGLMTAETIFSLWFLFCCFVALSSKSALVMISAVC
jgi:hypothetical protein